MFNLLFFSEGKVETQIEVLAIGLGFFSAYSFLEIVGRQLLDNVVDGIDSIPPEGIKASHWKRITNAYTNSSGVRGGRWIGRFEIILFFTSFWLSTPELIAGWLVFKVGSKWQTWNTMIKVPEKISRISQVDYLRVRHAWGTLTLTRFSLGTLANIVYALLGTILSRLIIASYVVK